MHEVSQGPLNVAVSSQKALQGSQTEMRDLLGGTEEISPTRGVIDLPSSQINDYFYTKETETIELMATPERHPVKCGSTTS